MSYAHLVAGLHASHTIAISSSAVPAVATAINNDMNSVFIVSSCILLALEAKARHDFESSTCCMHAKQIHPAAHRM
jgi:hypothetical protein